MNSECWEKLISGWREARSFKPETRMTKPESNPKSETRIPNGMQEGHRCLRSEFGIRIFALTFALLSGCATAPTNPSFKITTREADQDLARIVAARKPFARPLVIITGFMDPGLAAFFVQWRFESLSADDRMIAVPMGEGLSFDYCRDKVIDAVERRFPSDDPSRTVEVDVIGLSMGGVVARYAALPPDDKHKRQLRINRLFTVSSPLCGSELAQRVPAVHPLIYPLRPGSRMLAQINSTKPAYAIFPYVLLNDHVIGLPNAAPPGQVAWWLSSPPLGTPHFCALFDSRITADIARRLRDEPALATAPRSPLPVPG